MKGWIDKKPEIRKFKKWEASWLAGTIDGEGSIGLYNYGKEGRRVLIQISNTDESYVSRVKEIIGCGSQVNRSKWHIKHKGRKMMYLYSLKGSNRCYHVLKQIVPFLIIKKQKALNIINELEEKPFGRWANATPENRRLHSERLKNQWQDPVLRKKRLEGFRNFYESKTKNK